MTSHRSGRHFLQIPGPTPVPDRILRAIDRPTIDHRGPEFQALGKRILSRIGHVFQTTQPVIIYPASGTGAWEAALVNTLSPGDTVLMAETGHFATLWKTLALKMGLKPIFIGNPDSQDWQYYWRRGADVAAIAQALQDDQQHEIKAVCVVHNETSTGAVSDIAAVRQALDTLKHPALLLVDTISSLGSIDYRHEEWGVDVTISGSQKGLMLPPGLSFNAISEKALAANKNATSYRSFWAWDDILAANKSGFWHYTPATNLLYGLDTALDMLLSEGMSNVFARHARYGRAVRACVAHWGLEILVQDESAYSDVLTAVVVPEGHNADELRACVLKHFDLSLGTGLSKLSGRVFRIGHLGDTNELTLIAALAGVEMGLTRMHIPHRSGGVNVAMAHFN
jgi:alanine-glyoxylate transaminase/serine-glyoxylate transaminase/serine-pyruvate transaminase